MIEITGDIRDSDTWSKEPPEDKDVHLCVTTNGYILDRTGKVAMGAGVAKLFRDTHNGIDGVLTNNVRLYGNVPNMLWHGIGYKVFSFPTKYRWNEYSDIELIKSSAECLVRLHKDNNAIWVIPRPGCGCGGLDWVLVRQAIQPILTSDDFWIIDKKS